MKSSTFTAEDYGKVKEISRVVFNRIGEYPEFLQTYFKKLPTNHPDKWKAGEAYIEFQTLKNRIHYINILSFTGGRDFSIATENNGNSLSF